MTAAIIILYFLVITVSGVAGYLLWAFHNRLESLSELHVKLADKVTDGEKVIIENFELIQKRFSRLENEIKNAKTQESHIKAREAVRAARLARQRESE